MSNELNQGPDAPQESQPQSAAGKPVPSGAESNAEHTDVVEYRKVEGEYGAEQLEHLSDLEHVRQRPAMYIGDTSVRGLHHLVYEVVDNSIDEAMAGHAHEISVTITADGSVIVEDDGRGIPVEVHPDLGFSTLQGVMTVLKFGGKFSKGAYVTSGGLHGVGVTVVNFLSEWCEVEVRRGGHVYQQEYERGVPTGDVRRIGTTNRTGTKTTFKPDPEVFQSTQFSYNVLHRRLQELAFLNPGVKIVFLDRRTGDKDTFEYKDGIKEFVRYLNRSSEPLHPEVIYLGSEFEIPGAEGEFNKMTIEIALQYTSEYTENVHSFVNNISTIEGGTHLSGFRAGLTRTLNTYGKKEDIFKDLVPTGEDVREGLTAVIAIRVPFPQFEGQTKTKLGNSEVEGIVNSAFGDFLGKHLEENPKSAKIILQKAVTAAEARESARKAREAVRSKKGLSPAAACPASSAIVRITTSTAPNCTWWRAIPPADRRRAGGSGSSKQCCRFAARSSTPISRARTRCSPTKRSRASSRPWGSASATKWTSPSGVTARSSS